MHRSPASVFARVVTLMIAALSAAAGAADNESVSRQKDFPGIQKLMTAEEFARTGLDRLTPEQVRALDDWLVRYTAGEAYVVQTTSEQVRAAVPEFRIEARIVPPFNGWSGQTLFRLDNGQVWEQTEPMPSAIVKVGDEVTVKKALFGSFTLVTAGRIGTKVRRVD